MRQEHFDIGTIPAVLWGEGSERVVIAVHGNQSSKTDFPIELLAESALNRGLQVLSFDLPEHGDRKEEGTPCLFSNCIADLAAVMRYAKSRWKQISLFANSMGAYFSLMAYREEPLERAWFLSPVVDMRRVVENMMAWFHVTAEYLEQERTVSTLIGQKLYWDDYCYVREHPVCGWKTPTEILYGDGDKLCERDTVLEFAEKFCCRLEIIPGAEHYFHTPEQLRIFSGWLNRTMAENEAPAGGR